MKCPCCETDVPPFDFMYFDRKIYIGGEWYFIPSGEGRVLNMLSKRDLPTNRQRKGSMAVMVSRLREFLSDVGAPYVIVTVNRSYQLRPINVKNHDDAERSQDVHS
jgi:hypothetical protein